MKSGAHKGKIVWVIAGLCAVALLVFSLWEREPEYQGKKLSEWCDMSLADPRAPEAIRAIQTIGTNGIPFFITWIKSNRPGAKTYLRMVANLPVWARRSWLVQKSLPENPYIMKGSRGVRGFQVLGPSASSAIPQLSTILESWNDKEVEAATKASYGLSYLGKDGLQALLGILENTRNKNQKWVIIHSIKNMAYLGTNAAPAIPLLVDCANHNDALPNISANEALENWVRSPDPLLRLLVVRSIENMGTNANNDRWAKKVAREACTDSDERVRMAATNTLSRIQADAIFDL